MKYKIGDTVWVASTRPATRQELCPDCFGQKFLTAILGDGEHVKIDCVSCASGYDPPKGWVEWVDYVPYPRLVTIQRIEITDTGVEYGHDESYRSKETDLFETKEDALKRCEERQAISFCTRSPFT